MEQEGGREEGGGLGVLTRESEEERGGRRREERGRRREERAGRRGRMASDRCYAAPPAPGNSSAVAAILKQRTRASINEAIKATTRLLCGTNFCNVLHH